MANLINGRSEVVNKLVEIFQMPKHTKSFNIKCSVNSVLTIECEYYPENFVLDENDEIITLSKKFRLREVEE